MRFAWLFAAVLVAGCGRGKPTVAEPPPAPLPVQDPQERIEAELESLKGTWRAISITTSAMPVPMENVERAQVEFVFEGNRLLSRNPDRPDRHATVSLDPMATPKRMTITAPDMPPMKAAYQIVDGKSLKLCVVVDENPDAGYPVILISTTNPRTDLLILERR